ncbi:MAG: hypothetical protein ISR65_14260 [Bacteriovoracaceae bacterium]|nr:hypothetical protein [Bacteriovoracaceae bacterium]
MKIQKLLLICLIFFTSANLWAYGVGYSTFPSSKNTKMIASEFTGVISEDGGVGAQIRYAQKITDQATIDTGLGISGGERSSGRLFVGVDYEVFPDYMKQPRLSVKTSFANVKEYESRRNIISITPILSKGFSFWGHESFPYVAIPAGLNLSSNNETYKTTITMRIGINGKLPFKGYNHLLVNTELGVNIKDSYSGFSVGLSYPIN